MITLNGLTPLQIELADRIWKSRSEEDIAQWLGTLPRSLREQAQSLLYLIMVECIDQDPLEDLSMAQAVIHQVR